MQALISLAWVGILLPVINKLVDRSRPRLRGLFQLFEIWQAESISDA
jgi:hypothetical protein